MWEHMPVVKWWMKKDFSIIEDTISGTLDSRIIVKKFPNYDYEELTDFWNTHYDTSLTEYKTKCLLEPDSVLLELWDDNRLIGTIYRKTRTWILNGKTTKVGHIDWLCIHSAFRKKGLAGILIKAIYKYDKDILIHAFMRDGWTPFGTLSIVSYKILDVTKSSSNSHSTSFRSDDAQIIPKRLSLMKKIYQQFKPKSCGVTFSSFWEFWLWIECPLRWVIWKDAHLSFIQDTGMCHKDTGFNHIEIVWSNGVEVDNTWANIIQSLGYHCVIVGNHVDFETDSSWKDYGYSCIHLFNCKNPSVQELNFF